MPHEPNLSLPWPHGRALDNAFFDRDARLLARELLGKVIRHKHGERWLSVRIIETEAYYLAEKGSHASLGYTHNRRALFADGGHLYMYYARGGDSLNFSAQGPGNAVLIKSALPWLDAHSDTASLAQMQANNPAARGHERLFVEDLGIRPAQVVQCTRLGIPLGRDEQLPYRFVDADLARYCTRNPLRRGQVAGRDFHLLNPQDTPL